MKAKEFFFELPEELIAQNPPKERGQSRLMVVKRDTQEITHTKVADILDHLPPNALMIFNNSKVRKARLFGESESGGRVEFLLIKKLGQNRWQAMVNKAKKQRVGKVLHFPGDKTGTIIQALEGSFREVEFDFDLDDDYLDQYGHIPLPPYIKREDRLEDQDRYQNVFSEEVGSVAAPTAGLHFTEEILEKIKAKGIEIDYITLHVGLGTFAPLRAENILDHKMHTEEFCLRAETVQKITKAKREGRPVIAVGTTSVRTLESAYKQGTPQTGWQETDLFIYPGFQFQVVDHLFTNFHTPDSTLIILVSAFAGKDLIKKAYTKAIEEKYRFFSYGDGMLIL